MASLIALVASMVAIGSHSPESKASIDGVFPDTISFSLGVEATSQVHTFNGGSGGYNTTLTGYCMDLGKSGPVGVPYNKVGVAKTTSSGANNLSRIGWILSVGYPRTTSFYGQDYSAADAVLITQWAIWSVQEGHVVNIGANRPDLEPIVSGLFDLSAEHVTADSTALANNIACIYKPSDDTGRQYVIVTTTEPWAHMTVSKSSANPDITVDNPAYSVVGAEYGLYTSSACTTFVKHSGGGDVTFTIGENGKSTVLHTVPAGDYYLKELKAPRGYILDTTPIPVHLESAGDLSKAVTDKPYTGAIKVVKKDAATGATVALPGFKFKLYEKGTDNQIGSEQTTGDDGTAMFSNLPLGEYEVLETEATGNYAVNETRVPVTIKQKDGTSDGTIDGATEPEDGIRTIVITEIDDSIIEEKTSATVKKVWEDNNDADGIRPSSLTVALLEDGTDTGKTVTLNAGNNWQQTIGNLDKYAADGTTEIVYTWSEKNLPEGYTLKNQGTSGTITTITNSHPIKEKTSATVKKVWEDDDDADGIRPSSLTVALLADGTDTGKTATLNAGNNWQQTIDDLDKYAADGTTSIAYTWSEKGLPDGYVLKNQNTSGTITTITNKHDVIPKKTSATVKKVWEDNDDAASKRPSGLTVTLLADGTDTGKTVTLNADNNWQQTIDDLDKYAADGTTEIAYTWSEKNLPAGYVLKNQNASGTITTITNEYVPEKTSATVKKIWEDENDADGIRPQSLTVALLADGTDTGKTATLNADNNWQQTIDNLDKYAADGTTAIAYTWSEKNLPSGYVLKNQNASGTITTITNKHDVKISATVKKIWDDKDDEESIRPSSLTVALLADGADTGKTVTLNAGNNWQQTIDDLDKYAADGTTAIVYTWSEKNLPAGYTLENQGTSGAVTTITNKHEVKTSATVKKVWNDSNDKMKLRPASLTMKLSNGQTVTLNAANNWQATIENLQKYDSNGNEIEYTWSEEGVPDGYKLSDNSRNGTVTSITNTADIPTIGTKLATSDGGDDILVTKSSRTITLTDTVSYTNLIPGKSYEMRGSLHYKNGTEVSGATANTIFVPTDATGTTQVSFQLDVATLTGDVVAFEELYLSGTLIADHKDVTDTNQTVQIHRPTVGTTLATVDGKKEILVPNKGTVTLTDKVAYSDLIPGKEYTLTGVLHMRDGNDDKGAVGNEVTKKFTPTTADGTIDVGFEVDLSSVDVSSVVAFEKLGLGSDVIAEHEDITDDGQTVTLRRPKLKTKFADTNGSSSVTKSSRTITVTDHVEYSGLIPDKEYELRGTIHVRKGSQDAGEVEGATATKKFTPTKESGSETLEFKVDLSSFEGDAIVAFEELRQDDILVGVHTDISDSDQTIELKTPSIGTSLATVSGEKDAIIGAETKTVELVDTVSYHGLTPGQEYVMRGELHAKSEDGTDAGAIGGSVGEIRFTPKTEDGTVEVRMTVDATKLDGNVAVAFEELSCEDEVIASHKDINDEGQTVKFHKPSIGTQLMTEDGKKSITSAGKVALVDTVEYHDLIPGREYELRGEIHQKGSNGDAGAISGTQTSMRFTPDSPDGTVKVKMSIDASDAFQTIVAFEELYTSDSDESGASGTKIAEHRDINDSGQSITISIIAGGVVRGVASDLVRTGGVALSVLVATASSALAAIGYATTRHKRL